MGKVRFSANLLATLGGGAFLAVAWALASDQIIYVGRSSIEEINGSVPRRILGCVGFFLPPASIIGLILAGSTADALAKPVGQVWRMSLAVSLGVAFAAFSLLLELDSIYRLPFALMSLAIPIVSVAGQRFLKWFYFVPAMLSAILVPLFLGWPSFAVFWTGLVLLSLAILAGFPIIPARFAVPVTLGVLFCLAWGMIWLVLCAWDRECGLERIHWSEGALLGASLGLLLGAAIEYFLAQISKRRERSDESVQG